MLTGNQCSHYSWSRSFDVDDPAEAVVEMEKMFSSNVRIAVCLLLPSLIA